MDRQPEQKNTQINRMCWHCGNPLGVFSKVQVKTLADVDGTPTPQYWHFACYTFAVYRLPNTPFAPQSRRWIEMGVKGEKV